MWAFPGISRGSHPGCDRGLSPPRKKPGFLAFPGFFPGGIVGLKSPGYGPSLVYPGVRNPGSHPGCDRGLSPPRKKPGFATCPIPGFSRVVLLGVVVTAPGKTRVPQTREKPGFWVKPGFKNPGFRKPGISPVTVVLGLHRPRRRPAIRYPLSTPYRVESAVYRSG